MKDNLIADLHLHTAFSDGTDSVSDFLKTLKERNIGIFSVTDHDTVDFYNNVDYTALDNMVLIKGIEFSCRTSEGKCHILGYGIDTQNSKLNELITTVRSIRNTKLHKRLEHLKTKYNIIFSDVEIKRLNSLKSVGKPHLAENIVKMGYAENIGDAIKKYLSNIPKDESDRIDASRAIDAILLSGGIPIWAHPLGGEGERPLTDEEFLKQLDCLSRKGIAGVELYYSRYGSKERSRITKLIQESPSSGNFLFSGGSDYHGKVKNIEAGTLDSGGECINAGLLTILEKFI